MKIAIVKLSALGDIIHAMIALQFIKKNRPDIVIDWVVEEVFSGILEHNPHIRKICTVNLKKVKKQRSILQLVKTLKKVRKFGQYDLVIDAQGLLKSAIIARLMGKKVVGFDKYSIREKLASWFYSTTINIPYGENTILRNLLVICHVLNITVSHDDIIHKSAFLFFGTRKILASDNYIIFAPHSTWENRNYPADKFVLVANTLKIPCYAIWANKSEKTKVENMAKQSTYVKLAPKMSLDELKSFVATAQLLIGNDTGPTHIAWGLNIPSITIFGPTPLNRIYQTNINCAVKSYQKVDPLKLDKKDDSICTIEPAEIIQIAQKLLKGV